MPAAVDLPYLKVATTKRGAGLYYYLRKKGCRAIRLDPDDPDFMARYEAAIADAETAADAMPTAAKRGSLDEMAQAFLKSPEYLQLADKTRQSYRSYIDQIREKYGTYSARAFTRPVVMRLRANYATTPRTANYIVAVISRLYSWGIDNGFVKENPALRPKRLKTGPGHQPWEEWQIKDFRTRWKLGSLERTTMELALGTMQRGSDLVKMQRQHLAHGEISVVSQEKTGARIVAPLLIETRLALDAWLKDHAHVMLLTNPSGGPLTRDYLHKLMRRACDAAGLTECSTHGLRYTGARRHYEIGTDEEMIADVAGWECMKQARAYTKKKRRARLMVAKLDDALKAQDQNEKAPK